VYRVFNPWLLRRIGNRGSWVMMVVATVLLAAVIAWAFSVG
jgi:hypothetical protein